MIKIDKYICTGCTLCIKDCPVRDISIVDNKASFRGKTCLKCGHCIAICPKNAVSINESNIDTYNMEEVINYDKDTFSIDSDNLLNFIKFRRSIRYFKDKDVEMEKLYKIIEAGRYTPTAINSQNVSYIIVKDNIEKLKEMTLKALYDKGVELQATLTREQARIHRYPRLWMGMYERYKENPTERDSLFFNAPVAILVVSDHPVNATLAASNMELMANTLGVGALFNGFFTHAAKDSKEIKEFLGLRENQEVVSCIVLGYPDVTYQRTVPRKVADIKML